MRGGEQYEQGLHNYTEKARSICSSLFNYYRCYVPFFSIAVQPLFLLLKEGAGS